MASIAFPHLSKKAKLSDGTTYGFIHAPAAGESSKPTFLLLHGAPSSSYVWRHQVEHLSAAGYGVLAPDLLGYGDTDQPEQIEAYRLGRVCPQLHELATRVVGLDRVIGVGHDWGSLVLSRLYVQYKDLFSSLAFVANGFTIIDKKRSMAELNALARRLVGYPTSGYFEVFASPEGASLVEENAVAFESLIYAQSPEALKQHLGPEGALEKFLRSGEVLPVADWMSPTELETQSRILKDRYEGAFNWYKALVHIGPSEEDMRLTPEDLKVSVPTLLVVTEKDYVVLAEAQVMSTKAAAEDLQIERLQTGHWAMLEERARINDVLEKFATRK